MPPVPARPRDVAYRAWAVWEGLDEVHRALWFRAALLYAELNQSDLVKHLDVSQTSVSKWANARGVLLWPRWLAIAQIAGVATDWIPPPELLHRAWEDWHDDATRKGRPFTVPEPPLKRS